MLQQSERVKVTGVTTPLPIPLSDCLPFSLSLHERVCTRVCMYVCVRACVRACVYSTHFGEGWMYITQNFTHAYLLPYLSPICLLDISEDIEPESHCIYYPLI